MIELYYLIGVTTSLGSLAGWTKSQDTIMEYVSMWVGFQDIHGCITSWNDAHELDDKWMTANGDVPQDTVAVTQNYCGPAFCRHFSPQFCRRCLELQKFRVRHHWKRMVVWSPISWRDFDGFYGTSQVVQDWTVLLTVDYIELHWKSKHVLFQYMTFLTWKYLGLDLDICIDCVQKP